MENLINQNTNLIPPSPNIDIKNLRPFPRYCISIGAIPSSYMLSLSYEEQLLWFCNFLQNTVIPAINNNGQAVAELQTLFIQLKDYVDNYFKNLDIQEEISIKLDEMVEDGTLQQIMNNFLTNCFITFNTVQDMKNYQFFIPGTKIKTLGFYEINDGGNAEYVVKSNLTPNEMSIFQLQNNLFAELINANSSSFLDVRKLGAKGDDNFDNSDIIIFANSFNMPIILKNGTYKLTKSLIMTQSILGENAILKMYGATGYRESNRITLQYNNVKNKYIKNLEINGGWDSSILTVDQQFDSGIQLRGCENITIENCYIHDCVGDCITVSGHHSPDIQSKNINIINNNLINAWRNCISIICAIGCTLKNNFIKQVNGFLTAVDIEPNQNDIERVENLSIINNNIENHSSSPLNYNIMAAINLYDPNLNFKNIKILNNKIYNKHFYGIYADVSSNIDIITISNNIVISDFGIPLRLRNYEVAFISNNTFYQKCSLDELPSSLKSLGVEMYGKRLICTDNIFMVTSTVFPSGNEFSIFKGNYIYQLNLNNYYAFQSGGQNDIISNNIIEHATNGYYCTASGVDTKNSLVLEGNSFINMIGSNTNHAVNISKKTLSFAISNNNFDSTNKNIMNDVTNLLDYIPLNLFNTKIGVAYKKPTSGNFKPGDILLNANFSSSNNIIGWICNTTNPLTWSDLTVS